MNMKKAAMLFDGWEETLIWSCLQGCMGSMICDDDENPTSALIDVGDFCFFAGVPTEAFFPFISGFKLFAPQTQAWEQVIEAYYGERVNKFNRYAIKKEPDCFDVKKLEGFVSSLSDEYILRIFDNEMYDLAMSEPWSSDLCYNFDGYSDYEKRGIGVGILHNGKLVSGASSYTIYNGGIEIEIDTKNEYRNKGLATVCGAKLILECLKRGLYPSWDAHDLRSVALAEKLGYHMDKPYVAYSFKE